MALPNGAISSTSAILDAQTHIWNHMLNYISSMSLKCAVQLGIPDIIHKHGNPMTVSQLADTLSINKAKSNGLYRLMRLLVHSKFFKMVKISQKDEEEEEAYCLTPASRLLLKDEPLSVAPLTLLMLDPVMTEPFHHVSEWFQNDHPSPFFTKHGMTAWDYAGSDQRWNQVYNKGMASDAWFVASILVKECKHVFEGLKTMVDVGGGTGMVAKAVVDAFPGMKCIVLELPQVIAGLEGSDNLSFVIGDMMEFIPHADAVLLKWNLHMWTHEKGVKLLRNCKESINSKVNGGKVIIVEMVAGNQKEDHEATETQFLFDVLLMTRLAGGERTEKEWAKLFFDAGFTSYKISHVLGLRSVIEVFP